jgi:hypothetical protein
VIVPARPPVPGVEEAVLVGRVSVDLRCRVLVAGIVPAPRFGREAEVEAGVADVVARGADLADVTSPARLAGAAARRGHPLAVRTDSPDGVAAARTLGAAMVLVPPPVAAQLTGPASASGTATPAEQGASGGLALAVVVDDVTELGRARVEAERLGAVLAFDSARWSGAAATAREAAAVTGGCRVVRSADVRRSRRVAEVMAALLAAVRPTGPTAAGLPASEDGG